MTTTFFENKFILLTTAAISLTSGLVVYSTLAYMLMPHKIIVPLAIIISILVFGLSRYYSKIPTLLNDNQYSRIKKSKPIEIADDKVSHINVSRNNEPIKAIGSTRSIILISVIYIILIIINLFSKPDLKSFSNWYELSPMSFIQIGASIVLCFFLTGYTVIYNFSMKYKLNPLLKIILGYFFSILITGLTAYVASTIFDASATQIKTSLISVYIIILAIFFISNFISNRKRARINYIFANHVKNDFNVLLATMNLLFSNIKKRTSELLIFGSLFSLLIVSTYYLYGGITVGDQWLHQGRAILFLSGSFKEVAQAGLDSLLPPFQSALIAAVTAISGMPLVNAYASIAFLSILPLFSFYYFYGTWVPPNMQRSKLLASSLFTTCSGFGWIYLIGLLSTGGPIISDHSSIETINSLRSYILMPSNFIIASHPDFSTALIYITIPTGLVLIGLARQIFESKIASIIIVTFISTLGILSHDEFYLFIIIASILPFLFKIKEKSYLYIGLLLALFFISIINIVTPQHYYTFTEFYGIPLLILGAVFVSIMWFLYLILEKIQIIMLTPIKNFFYMRGFKKPFDKGKSKARIFVRWIIVTIVALVYLSSFIILSPLSLEDVNDEALRGAVPWYQYPMKLGVAGLLGIAFILSYMFRRFEKEIFVFGIIILAALLTSSYYDQHRFSKYVMLGMIGFASLLIYKMLEFRARPKPIVNGIILMVVVTTGSLSTLLFVGYNSLAFKNHDYVNDLGRRNFPTESEFHLMEALRNSTDIDSSRYNVISTPDEYNFYKGTLLTKLSTFAGFPTGKLLQGRFVLNVTTLDSLYRLLQYSNARFIVIPKESIKQEEVKLSEPVRFALDNFEHFYEDEKYVVLDVPPLAGPSSSPETNVALVYNGNDNFLPQSAFINTTLLQYNNATFNSNHLKQVVLLNNTREINSNGSQNTIVCGPRTSNGLTIWSKGLDDIVGSGTNYIDAAFRMAGSHNNSKWSDAGLRWNEGNKQYYASISKNGLELYEKTIANASKGEQDKKLLYQNSEVQRKDNVWYNLKVESLQNSVNVYVDGSLKAKYPRPASDNGRANLSSVGMSCFNSDVEFAPVKVGKIESSRNESLDKTKDNYEHFYPLSMLALSNNQYDTFMDKDLSALSKKIIILSADPLNWDNTTLNSFLNYVNQGGTLVVINSDSNLKGKFSQLFSMQDNANGSKIKFTNIMGFGNESPIISGMVKNISINPDVNANIIASYVDNSNQTSRQVAPFALEKQYPNGGKIILVNAGGYFDAISKSPGRYYSSLSNISSMIGLHLPKAVSTPLTTMPIEQFIGNMDISGNVTLRSHSIMQLGNSNKGNGNGYGSAQNYNINTQGIKIYEDDKLSSTFNNVSIKDLNLSGNYNVTINAKDIELPYMTSQHDYIGILMPKFNMTINLSEKPLSSAEIVIQNQKNPTSSDTIKLNGGSTIQFKNIQGMLPINGPDSTSMQTDIPILLKSPEIKVNGKAKFSTLRFLWHYLENVHFDEQALKTRFNFIDEYSEPHGNGTRIKYITFMNSTTKF